jgi:DNA replication and repair protein RecF
MLEAIRLKEFRCFREVELGFGEGMSVLVGDNAQGKTSVLEAVCVLMRLQSPRTSQRGDLVRHGNATAHVTGRYRGAELGVGLGAGSRRLRVDGAVVGRAADYLGSSGLVVWMGGDDLQIVRGGGEGRRRYLDFVGSQLWPDYRPTLRSYEAALRRRNYLLKRDAAVPWGQVDAFSEQLIQHGERLRAQREELVALLAPAAGRALGPLGGCEEELGMRQSPSGDGLAMREALREARGEELRRRQTLVGPHRDELVLELGGRAAAAYGSEGQQRSVALALKLAQARVLEESRGIAPLLLLDDIFGELDKGRRNALMESLPEGSQKLITTTHLDWWEGMGERGEIWRFGGGTVVREAGG